MKTNLLLFALSIFSSFQTFPQAPDWIWAVQSGDINFQVANAIALDHSGAIVSTGYFDGTNITFGSTTLSQSLTSTGVFVVKYNSSGNVVWAKRGGGVYDQFGKDIATDTSNNVIITGYFQGLNTQFETTILTNDSSNNTRDLFIAKYDASGNVVWAARAGGKLDDIGTSVAIDISGNIFLTGTFASSSIIFGTDTLVNANPGSTDMFLVKYNSSGTVMWARRMGGNSDDYLVSAAADPSGNIFITGNCSDTASFGSNTLNRYGMFIANYNTTGTVLWVKGINGSYVTPYSVASDLSGNALITGTYYGGSVTFGSTVLTNAGWEDLFLVKYDPSGNITWAKNAGGNASDFCKSVAVDENGCSYITGYHQSNSLIFGSDTLFHAAMSKNLFVAKYDSSGTVLWGKGVGSSTTGEGAIPYSIAVHASDNCYIAGEISQCTLAFDSITLHNSDYDNTLIAMLGVNPVGLEEVEGANSIDIYPNPGSGNFTIHINSSLSQPVLEIYDMHGKKVYSEKLKSDHIYFPAKKGIYFVKISDEGKLYTKKLIAE